MRVAYVSVDDPHNVRSWSGLAYFIPRALERHGVDVTYIGPVRSPWEPVYKVRKAYHRFLRGQTHIHQFEPGLMRRWGRSIATSLAGQQADVVLAPGAHHVLELETDLPVVTYGDATFASMLDYYSWFSHLSKSTIRNGHRLSRLSIERSAASIYASEWAAGSALRDYGADPERVHVIPMGANLAHPPSAEVVQRGIAERAYDRCRLLFVGVEWERKGGDLALEVAGDLNAAGVETELAVAGCEPHAAGGVPDFVRPLGFVSKATPDGRAQLDALLAGAHFLIVPSVAEAYGLVFCEASAYGVPSLARRTGGVPIRDGVNGWAFAPEAGPEPYVEVISRLMADPNAHREAARSARREYEERLNWDVAGAALKRVLEDVVATTHALAHR
jgi:glycosyltransferase involved in cell wall biosynthesis